MKIFVAAFTLSIMSISAYSQQTIKPKLVRDTSYMDSYSEHKVSGFIAVKPKATRSFKIEPYNSIVIVNGKIYDPKSDAFRSLDENNLRLEKSYTDTESGAEVKYVYVFRYVRSNEEAIKMIEKQKDK